jgi:hypothetical protein
MERRQIVLFGVLNSIYRTFFGPCLWRQVKLAGTSLENQNQRNEPEFVLPHRKRSLPYFSHPFNCGLDRRSRRTERTVELALADDWLKRASDPIEIGAVTPYYWPNRISQIVDPTDGHPLVTQRASLFSVDITGRDVLSISTVEHVGLDDYNQNEEKSAIDAVRYINDRANRFLITFPVGYNDTLDKFIFGRSLNKCDVGFLVRENNELWQPAGFEDGYRPYGDHRKPPGSTALGKLLYRAESFAISCRIKSFKPWANSICVIER